MDKLMTTLAMLRKYHFWILCVLIVIVGLAGWAVATDKLAQQYGQRKDQLDNHFRKVQDICERPDHPNPGVIDAINDETEELKANVLGAWRILYEEQKAKNQLPDGLSDDFKQKWNSLGPDEPIPEVYREEYQYFISPHFPKLFRTMGILQPAVGAEEEEGNSDRAAPEAAGRNGGDDEKPEAKMEGIVEWKDREQLPQRYRWSSTPSTTEVRMAQEDLWVYEALLRVVKNTNRGATKTYNAPIKRIDALQIGQEVPVVGKKAGASGKGTTKSGESKQSDSKESGLAAGRYVDNAGNPLQAGQQHPFAEFKIMPIRMQLLMDQRRIHRLLVECVNSNMPIEVRVLRLRPGEQQELDLAALAEKGADGGRPAKASATSEESTAEKQSVTHDLPIEVQGVIYIYNPPDEGKLGTTSAAEESLPPAAQPETAPATPIEAPPAGAPALSP